MKLIVSGSSGLIGSKLVDAARASGRATGRLLRKKSGGSHDLFWDPAAGVLNPADLEGVDEIVNLAGESIAEGRWTEARKKELRESRMASTRLLCETAAKLGKRPSVIVSASAIGIYGDRGDEKLTEASTVGSGFLAELCSDWEEATIAASAAGIRVVNLRIGVVLSKDGGALAKMLPIFRLGLGGILGSGKQYMSCISIDDLVSAIMHALSSPSLSGPVNGVAPHPVTNAEFTRTLGIALKRPVIFPAPDFALRLALGEMADELLLSSARVYPEKLLSSGFTFQHESLEQALTHSLE